MLKLNFKEKETWLIVVIVFAILIVVFIIGLYAGARRVVDNMPVDTDGAVINLEPDIFPEEDDLITIYSSNQSLWEQITEVYTWLIRPEDR